MTEPEPSDREAEKRHLTLDDLGEEAIAAYPGQAAAIIEFTLHNSKGDATRAQTIEPLRWLGAHAEFRGKAVELLGIVAQSDDAEVAAAAETAIRAVVRKKRS